MHIQSSVRYQLNQSALDRPSDRVSSRRDRTHEQGQARAGAGREATRADLDGFERGETTLVFVAQRYRIDRLIGRGGMASVYAAFDTRLERQVAIKVLAQTYDHRPKVLARFLREGRMTSRLEHPNIVRVLNFGITRNSVIYIAMELLEGQTLLDMLQAGPIELKSLLDTAIQIADALQSAHAKEGPPEVAVAPQAEVAPAEPTPRPRRRGHRRRRGHETADRLAAPMPSAPVEVALAPRSDEIPPNPYLP